MTSPLTPRINDIDTRIDNKDVKNVIINGGFDFWQRGISFSETSGASDYYADRFSVIRNFVSGTLNIDRSTDIPSELINDVSYSLKLTGSSLNVNWLAVRQVFETNFSKIINKKNGNVFVSFWVKSSKTGVFSAFLRNVSDTVNVDANYYKTLTIDSANTWERKTFAIPATALDLVKGADSAANWELGITIKAADTIPVEGWQRFDSSASGTDDFNFTANDEFWTTGWMLTEDTGEPDFNPEFQRAGRNYQEELQLCQRYYEKGNGSIRAYGYTGASPIAHESPVPFKVNKRTVPTVSFPSINDGGSDATVVGGGTWENAFSYKIQSTNATTNQYAVFTWTADAEL